MKKLKQIIKEFPNYRNIIQRFKDGGDTWLPNDFPTREYSRDVLFWYIRLLKVIENTSS